MFMASCRNAEPEESMALPSVVDGAPPQAGEPLPRAPLETIGVQCCPFIYE